LVEQGAGWPLVSVAGIPEGRSRPDPRPNDSWCSLVHNGVMNTKLTPPEVRLTIPVTPEVHAVFVRMSEAFRRPTGRLMGEWLQDHLQAAEEVCRIVEATRSAAGKAASLGALAASYADQAESLIGAAKGGAQRQAQRAAPHPGPKKGGTPPVSNTGGKVSGGNTPRASK
jgi:hypothetical protein